MKSTKKPRYRDHISLKCQKKNYTKTFLHLFINASVYLSGIIGTFKFSLLYAKVLCSFISGLGISMLFIWGHDCAHGALFKNSKLSHYLSLITMIPSFTMNRHWIYGHNKVHHGFTSLTTIDEIWKPSSPKEFTQLSSYKKILYKTYRSVAGSGLYYMYKIWWLKIMLYTPKDRLGAIYYNIGKGITLLSIMSMSIASYKINNGLQGLIVSTILPFLVFNYFIAIIVFLNHTHPEIKFYTNKKEWSHNTAAIRCSTIIKLSKISSFIMQNILNHPAHHLDTRIPFYNLEKANKELENHIDHKIIKYKFSWKKVFDIFNKCQLYDYENNIWHGRKYYKKINNLKRD